MNPDVAEAVQFLSARGLLSAEEALRVGREARGERISVYYEMRLALYAGVALITAGVGALVQQNLERIGPLAIASALGIGAVVCFFWVARNAPPFSWSKGASTHVAFDYVLLLGLLLGAADLAYVEANFTPLGPSWPWHLLIVSLCAAWLAFRFDSRVSFSLSLATFASWRGVSVSFLERGFWSNFETAMRLQTAGCGLLFVVVGVSLSRYRRKEHFAPVADTLGWILVLVSLASGSLEGDAWTGAYIAALLLTSSGLAVHSFRKRRFALFAMGSAGAYFALSRWVVPALGGDTLVFLWFFFTSAAAIAALVAAHRRLGALSRST